MKIRQVAQTIHSTFCRENCPCPPHCAVNGYHGEVRQSRITCDAVRNNGALFFRKAGTQTAAESVEERRLTEKNTSQSLLVRAGKNGDTGRTGTGTEDGASPRSSLVIVQEIAEGLATDWPIGQPLGQSHLLQ